MVKGLDAEVGPAVDHGEECEVGVGWRSGGTCWTAVVELWMTADGELIEDVFSEEYRCAVCIDCAEYLFACVVDAGAEGVFVACEHELEEGGCRRSILVDLYAGGGVENGEAGINVPLVRVNAEHDVYFDCFNSADVLALFPGIRALACPGCAHAVG